MIRIYVNITGTPQHPVVMQHDTVPAESTMTVVEPGRGRFEWPDGTPAHGATVIWFAATQKKIARTVIPGAAGDYEGGLLTPPLPTIDFTIPAPALLPRIHPSGARFVTEGGREWVYKGASDFSLLKHVIEGRDIIDLLLERRDAGANVVRVFGSIPWHGWELHPGSYPSYYDDLRDFARLVGAARLYLELTVYTAFPPVIGVAGSPQDHYARVADTLRDEPNVLLELGNECSKNHIPAGSFQRAPVPLLQSQGSEVSDRAPILPGWDYHTWHGRRDWPKVTSSSEDAWYVSQGEDDDGVVSHPVKPTVHDEPLGFSDQYEAARRSTDPRLARQIGASCAALLAGGTYHSERGLRSERWTTTELQCAIAFFDALAPIG